MKNVLALMLVLNFVFSTLSVKAQRTMTNEKMAKIFEENALEVEGSLGSWQMIFGERLIIAITDKTANRMRLFTPVVEEDKLEKGQMRKMLEANFHSALDAKYCLYNGFVISVFTHPLKELTEEQLIDAMKQVGMLADTFGTSYSSMGLIFGSGMEEPKINQSPSGGKKN